MSGPDDFSSFTKGAVEFPGGKVDGPSEYGLIGLALLVGAGVWAFLSRSSVNIDKLPDINIGGPKKP